MLWCIIPLRIITWSLPNLLLGHRANLAAVVCACNIFFPSEMKALSSSFDEITTSFNMHLCTSVSGLSTGARRGIRLS
ncbi:hypothetical protein F5Y05DRAFT_388267 [Hypoxylon sp. FL0543]|nr:hypothetical protein F5Y05DRAFT_388267 [Hypoxylon sp. FL0543]